ncbi:MAG: AAA family ATPase [Prevotella sp.]|nr:AAA family ATPase [Prevotella sp.]
MDLQQTQGVRKAIEGAYHLCEQYKHEFVMPEHFLLALLSQREFCDALDAFHCNRMQMAQALSDFLNGIERVPDGTDVQIALSVQMGLTVDKACRLVESSNMNTLDVPHLVKALMDLQESAAAWILQNQLDGMETEFLTFLIDNYDVSAQWQDGGEEQHEQPWKRLVTCINDHIDEHNELIGRDAELERTIQVLCRKDKNNPLHVGEPGVGKTALVYGLARLIEKGDVPERLKGSRIYMMDLGTMLSGTQFRGDFEKRIKEVMEGVSEEGNAIVYIDEIHNLVGAGAVGESSMDASNMLKPYLESGKVKFIGSTTYDEYNRYLQKSRGLVRRFQQIDILEPSIDETIRIVKGLKRNYEKYHGVHYTDSAIEYAVQASAKYVNDRFLPDKAIDLIDEAGAFRQTHPLAQKRQTVDKTLISSILSKICKVETLAVKDDDSKVLARLQPNMLANIYGQDEAVRQVVEAVQMAKAGLLDDNKPMGSLLFIGPTGVGKTEVAKVLAQQLGIELVRFDMSEYTEKHAVAKLIGSPAGYVGYEDGGLLTDAIRKTPHCVLLLDEIEKAHSDIYNILLQVMDYARLTDNKGRKADFRNVVLIMTSNAGAQYASQANVGFQGKVSRGEAMLAQARKTFKPEFLNRLSATVVFRDMDHEMAKLILKKKLRELEQKLSVRKVTMNLSDDAFDYLLEKGFTREYGAREMDRVIGQTLKPLLMREILFGKLRHGGNISIHRAMLAR